MHKQEGLGTSYNIRYPASGTIVQKKNHTTFFYETLFLTNRKIIHFYALLTVLEKFIWNKCPCKEIPYKTPIWFALFHRCSWRSMQACQNSFTQGFSFIPLVQEYQWHFKLSNIFVSSREAPLLFLKFDQYQ